MTSPTIKRYRDTPRGKATLARNRRDGMARLAAQGKKRKEYTIYKEDEIVINRFITILNKLRENIRENIRK